MDYFEFFDVHDDDDYPNPRPDETHKEDVENDRSEETQQAKHDQDCLQDDPGH